MEREEFDLKYTAGMNEQQLAAVHSGEGAVLLLAVPGSGKTTVLINRLGYMILCLGIAPEKILTVTYTVAATQELRRRFSAAFGSEYGDRMEFRTINGLASKIIEYYSRRFGHARPFELLDNEGEAAALVSRIYQQLFEDYPSESTVKELRSSITYIKNMLLSPEEIKRLDSAQGRMGEIYERYSSTLRSLRLMDYDDQLTYALKMLRSIPELLRHFQQRFPYICVDEAQDTSRIQHEIIKLLAGPEGNIFMVGDEDQSIYGFRAAYPQALLSFREDYKNAELLFMEENFRSSSEITEAAGAFIAMNTGREDKRIRSRRGSIGPVKLIEAESRLCQYKYLLCLARDCTEDTGVLFRNNDSALPLIDLLERSGLSYNFRGGDLSFFSHRIVNDLRDISSLAYEPGNCEAFMGVYYKLGCHISRELAEYSCRRSRESGREILEELLMAPNLEEGTREAVFRLVVELPELKRLRAREGLSFIWKNLRYGRYAELNRLDSGKYFILRCIAEPLEDIRALWQRLEELRELVNLHKNSPGCLYTLSTVHSAKGLEYKRVYLLDVLDGVLPCIKGREARLPEERRVYEEERRIFYVAMTRARDELFLFHCRDAESEFVDEIKARLPVEFFYEGDIFSALSGIKPGAFYCHRSLGRGRVSACDGDTALLSFENGGFSLMSYGKMYGERRIMLRPAKEQSAGKSSAGGRCLRAEELRAGLSIFHRSFGEGRIIRVQGDEITVQFKENAGMKHFGLKLCLEKGLLRTK